MKNSIYFISIILSCLCLPVLLTGEDLLQPFTDINPGQAQKLIEKKSQPGKLVILDVRTAPEFAPGHLQNARLIDYKAADFADQVGRLDKNATYLVYCRSGRRSAAAMKIMKTLNFKTVFNLQGGIVSWQNEKKTGGDAINIFKKTPEHSTKITVCLTF